MYNSQIFTKFIIGGDTRAVASAYIADVNTLHRLQDRVGRRRADGPELRRLHEELLELGDDVLAVRVLAQRADVRPDLVHEHLALRGLRHVDHLLHHVVGVLVLHHHVQSAEKCTTTLNFTDRQLNRYKIHFIFPDVAIIS